MKKVFIIVGTARSGSTLLSLMLANSPHGFSVGELIQIMRPNRPSRRFNDRTCFCSDPSCSFWKRMANAGEKDIYAKIFEECENLNFIVDASKRHLWFKDQLAYSKNKNYEVIPILTYKTPLEYAYSKAKRNDLSGWKKGWIKEHRLLFGVLNDFVSVNYKELAQKPAKKLEVLCHKLKIPYFEGKECFWNSNNSHSLFGSTSVKESEKLIYYKKQYHEDKLDKLRKEIALNDPILTDIIKVLNAFEVGKHGSVPELIYTLKKELGPSYPLSDFIYRIQATPYYVLNRTILSLTKLMLKVRSTGKKALDLHAN